jgi:hypothetical protein
VQAGYGSIRINPANNDHDNYMYMSLTSRGNWHCDLGIPAVITKPVYNEFYKYSREGAPWIKELEGVLVLQQELPFKELIPTAIGARLSKETEDTLRYRPRLPKLYVLITSPLNVKFRYNNTHPPCTG